MGRRRGRDKVRSTTNASTSAPVIIARPRQEVFDFCCRNDTYERHLRPRGPVAGVAEVELLDGDAPEAGGRRRVVLTDGGTRVDWGYEFELRSALAYPLALPIMPLFRAWLTQSLRSIRDELSTR